MPTFNPLEGLENEQVQTFTTIKDVQTAVNSRQKQLEAGATNQYVVFRPVTREDLIEIDRQRDKIIGRSTRISHYGDSKILVLKLHTRITELVCSTFNQMLTDKVEEMGLQVNEGDSAFNPRTDRQDHRLRRSSRIANQERPSTGRVQKQATRKKQPQRKAGRTKARSAKQ